MRRRLCSLLLLLATALSLILSACSAPAADSSSPPSDAPLDGEAYMAKLAEQGWESSPFALHDSFQITPAFRDGTFDVRGADLSQWMLTANQCSKLCYDSRTVFPDDLPQGFDPAADLELGLDPGLGVRTLHTRGITGAGVNVGIVDMELSPHQEYDGKIRYYYTPSPDPSLPSMHGPAVTSVAVGERAGVAPGARVYYEALNMFAANQFPGDSEEYYQTMFLSSIHHLLDLNEILPPEDRISVISLSGYIPSDLEIYQQAVVRAEEQGVWLLTVNEFMEQGFCGMIRAPLADPNDPESYEYRFGNGSLGVPMGRRTYASMCGEIDFEQDFQGGLSWAVPYLAGIYALARQVDPTLTPDDFVALAHETARIPQAPRLAYDGQNLTVLDPVALIGALETHS